MKKTIALLLALVMLFALAACSNTADDNKASDNPGTTSDTPNTDKTDNTDNTDSGDGTIDRSDLGPIKIGHICDLTGTDALTGKQAQEAMDYAKQYIGAICGREVEIIHKDSQSSASAAADAARALIEEDEVDVIFGPTMIGHKMAVANVVKNYEVPAVFYNPTPTVPDIMNNEWVVGAAGSNPQMPTVMADYVYNELGYRKVVTLTKDDAGGTSYMDPFTKNFEALGGEVLVQRWVSNEATDYSSDLIALADSGADCLVAWTSGSAAIQLWQEWYNMGLNKTLPMVAVFHGAFTDTFICDALSNVNADLVAEMQGTVAPMTWAYNAGDPEIDNFIAAFREDHDGAYPIGNNLAGATVQNMILLKAAVEALEGDTTDKAALRDALLAADITGPEGRTVFENGSNMANKDIYVVEIATLDDGTYNYSFLKKYENVPVGGLTVD
ncbi:MAG: ABC transporter substrate-binding protein [Oscillospiraceae bacterium]